MSLIDETRFDTRYALRAFRRSPGFTSVALTTLVVGIAAVTSIFSYMNAVYFAALPYKDANRIVALSQREMSGNGNGSFSAVSLDAIRLVRQSARSFERLAAYREGSATIMFGTEPRSMRVLGVDSSFVPLFDLRPELGRLITTEEISAEAPVAMISSLLWRTQFGGDPDVIGKTLTLDKRTVAIVGVMPPGFRYPYQTDAITPLHEVADSTTASTDAEFSLLGKLRPGISHDAARAEVRLIGQRLGSVDPRANAGASLLMRDESLPRNGRSFLPLPGVFLGAGLFVLLIACANVANLFLVRGAERRGELAVRASLGAGRWRLVRQMLTETLLLGAVAAALGTALSAGLVRLGMHYIPTQGFPSWFHIGLDTRVLAFAVAVTLLVTVAVGLVPAREGTRFDLVGALKRGGDGGTATSGVARASKRGLAVQLALAVSLFVSAALLVRSYQRLSQIDLGYPAERIAIVKPLFEEARYPELSSRVLFAEQVVSRVSQLPGVSAVAIRGSGRLRALPSTVPAKSTATASRAFDSRLIPDRDTTRAIRMRPFPSSMGVSDGYFALLGLRVRQGRNFAPDDVAGSTPATVISAQVARSLWGATNAVGHTIQLGAQGDALTVIGVVDDVRSLRGGGAGFSDAPIPTLYLSSRQAEIGYPEILATGAGDAVVLHGHIVDLVRAADPSLLLLRDVTLASQFDEAFLVTKVFGGLIGVFAVSALALSIIGIYGVVAFGVARRTREIGIRIAVGGTIRDVMRIIMLDGLRFVGIGIAVGLALAVALGRLVRIFLFGVSPLDPVAYAAVCLLFGIVAIVACYLPARRVTRVDPLVALRSD
jgi:putative ABC transport system permease protein